MKTSIFALTAVLLAATDARAKTVSTLPDTGMNVPDIIQMFHAASLHRPDFKKEHSCIPTAGGCATVEFSTREPDADGKRVIEWFIFPDNDPQHPVWCSTTSDHVNQRLCQQHAGSDPYAMATWVEAFFPKPQEFREIATDDPACKAFQHSQYEIDNSYVDCVVGKSDGQANIAPALAASPEADAAAKAAADRDAAEKALAEAQQAARDDASAKDAAVKATRQEADRLHAETDRLLTEAKAADAETARLAAEKAAREQAQKQRDEA